MSAVQDLNRSPAARASILVTSKRDEIGDCNFTRHGPALPGGFVIVLSWMRESSRASNIQCSATFSYALFTNGSLACAARCLASSAFRRQSTISDDIRGGPQMDRAKRQVRRCSGSERDVSLWSNRDPSQRLCIGGEKISSMRLFHFCSKRL
jgi:hypothetical protein